MDRVLVVDDEIDICEILKFNLENNGYSVDTANSGEEALAMPLEKYDLFLCMDSMNVRNALRILGADKDCKVKKLMDYTDEKGDVADPWYTGRFDVTYSDIERGCKALLKELTEND